MRGTYHAVTMCQMRAVVRHLVGWTSLLVGGVGLVLPLLPGWPFIGLGALLLAPDVPVFNRLLCAVEDRFPLIRQWLVGWRARLGHHRESGH